MRWVLPLFLAVLPLASYAEITDAELRKLFIVTSDYPTEHQYGGIVFFKGYFQRNKTACAYKRLHPETTVFVDQEGGTVVRLPDAAPPSPAQARGMAAGEFHRAVRDSAKKLKAACIDANLAPVVEVSNDQARSYSGVPEVVVPIAKIFSEAMQAEGIKTVLKHFPGWNEHCKSLTQLDSIKLKVRPKTEAQQCSVRENERYQFQMKAQTFNKVPANAWMVGNNIIAELGPYPSNMNPVVRDLIRNHLSYKGLLISDALWEIEASPKAVLMALKVVDWVMLGTPAEAEDALPLIRQGIKTGLFTEAEVREKLNRIDEFRETGTRL